MEKTRPMHDYLDSFKLLRKAMGRATRQHCDTLREDGTPYAAHPVRVFLTLWKLFGIDDPATLCAALLHDTIEHGNAKFEALRDEFGEDVAAMVAALSEDSRLPEDEREAEAERQIREGGWKVQAVKLADAYDNLIDGKDGAREKAAKALAWSGDDPRLETAKAQVGALFESR